MRILILTKHEEFGVAGIGIQNERFHQFLKKHGHTVHELRFSNNEIKDKDIDTIPYYWAGKRTMVFLPAINTLNRIKDQILKFHPDIIYMSVGISPLDFSIPDLCHKYNVPIAATWHGDYSKGIIHKLPFYAYIPFCKNLDLLHVFSSQLKNFYTRKKVDKNKIVVIPNGVDEKIYSPQGTPKKRILFLGRITSVKQPEILIKAFLKSNISDYELIFVGTGELEKKLKEKYPQKNIKFLGLITNENQKIKIIRSCQIFVLPSKFEGMSLSLLEAMSIGLAVITTNVGNHADVVKNAGICLKDDKNLEENLSQSLKKLVSNQNLIKDLGQKARQKILKQYTQSAVFSQLEKALKVV